MTGIGGYPLLSLLTSLNRLKIFEFLISGKTQKVGINGEHILVIKLSGFSVILFSLFRLLRV